MDLLEQIDAVRDRYRPTNRITPRRDWYRINNKSSTDVVSIHIFDEIGWFGITASDFVKDLNDITAATIELHINSPGGEVFDGLAIMATLQQHPATVDVIIDGLAASIASVIAVGGGDTVTITPHASMMIHDGMGLAIGNSEDHRSMADLLDRLSDQIAAVYSDRSNGDRTTAEWRALMRAETWFNADEALEAGLVDSILAPSAADDVPADAEKVAAEFDLSVFDFTISPTTDPKPEPVPEPVSFDPADVFSAIREAVQTS